ncbi:MAG: alpha/beta fold hydrolase [Spirochaetia bacterium]|nr:alpha/beta fold hydrolase [Spirochaetia bacterium]
MEKYIELDSRKGKLRGMLHLPDTDSAAKFPGVILYHGFSGDRMEPGFMFVRFSRLLAGSGIASARFDFLGSGESDGIFTDMTFSGEVEQASTILDYFKSLDMIDENNIILLGLSMGGAVAGYLAGMRSSDLAGLVLWAPAGEMRLFIEKREKQIENGEITGDIMDISGLRLGEGFIEDVRQINVFEKTAGYRGEVLIVHGTGDTVVPVAVSEAYMQVFSSRAELVLIDEADHTFQGIPWIKQLFDASLKFIQRAGRKQASCSPMHPKEN